MIDLEKQVIRLNDREFPITRFDVWWMVDGFGLYPGIKDALKTGRRLQGMPVAVHDERTYEIIPPVIEPT